MKTEQSRSRDKWPERADSWLRRSAAASSCQGEGEGGGGGGKGTREERWE